MVAGDFLHSVVITRLVFPPRADVCYLVLLIAKELDIAVAKPTYMYVPAQLQVAKYRACDLIQTNTERVILVCACDHTALLIERVALVCACWCPDLHRNQ